MAENKDSIQESNQTVRKNIEKQITVAENAYHKAKGAAYKHDRKKSDKRLQKVLGTKNKEKHIKESRHEIIKNLDKKTLNEFKKLSYRQQNKVLRKYYAKDTQIARNKKTVIRYGKGSKATRAVKSAAKADVKILSKQAKIAKFIASEEKAEIIKQKAINKAKETTKQTAVKAGKKVGKAIMKFVSKLILNILAALGSVLLMILSVAALPVILLCLIIFIVLAVFDDTLIQLKMPEYYAVTDQRYCDVQYADKTIKDEGEGICTVAMLEEYITNNRDDNNPEKVANRLQSYYKSDQDGKIYSKIWKELAEKYSLDFTESTSWSFDKQIKDSYTYIKKNAHKMETSFFEAKHCYFAIIGMTKEKTIFGEQKHPVLITQDPNDKPNKAKEFYIYSPVKCDITRKYSKKDIEEVCDKFYVYTQKKEMK